MYNFVKWTYSAQLKTINNTPKLSSFAFNPIAYTRSVIYIHLRRSRDDVLFVRCLSVTLASFSSLWAVVTLCT